ncbi:MAG TPA: hypothetical protein VFD48_18120 [Pyrinomonadaceae bacterium]|nr:hypothetical protein [Pyrinomonadaceae bacterium]
MRAAVAVGMAVRLFIIHDILYKTPNRGGKSEPGANATGSRPLASRFENQGESGIHLSV